MTANRRYVLAGVVLALGLVTGVILLEVLGTITLALTVAYVLLPVERWLVRRGLSEWTASASATCIGFMGAVAVFSPLFVALSLRLEEMTELVRGLPAELSVTAFGGTITVETDEVRTYAVDVIQDVGLSIAAELPVLAIKFTLFVLLLFAIMYKGDAAGRAAIAPVPIEYRDVVYALARRARETLYAIYVLQLATSVATLAVAYPLFWVLGYDAAFELAMIAGILQFIPILGPSMLIAPIAIYHVAVGDLVAGVLVAVLGFALIASLPDVAVRPRLARRSANLPGSLYFVGFTGGLFTLGAIGVVVGPLVVAVFVEAVDLLADEVNASYSFTDHVDAATDDDGPGDSNGYVESDFDGDATDPDADDGPPTLEADDAARSASGPSASND
ncbi:AI-2E family transporter [Natrialbaceae archaeon GCM10025810]|uniref:AI-2E family transporter n=1 Tax=Halovalidus salilacus TaxID=3075124 RepID=UPI003605AF45